MLVRGIAVALSVSAQVPCLLVHHVPKKLQLVLLEFTFAWVECYSCSFDLLENCSQSLIMLGLALTEDENIIILFALEIMPKEVINVVRSLDFLVSRICQKPLFASSLITEDLGFRL